MDAEPTELKHEIEATRNRLDWVVDSIAGRLRRSAQHAAPLYVLRHHPLAVIAVTCGIIAGLFGAWRLDALVSRRTKRRQPVVIQIGGRH